MQINTILILNVLNLLHRDVCAFSLMTHTQDSSTRLRPSYHINSKPYTATATSTTLFEDNSDIDLDKSICEQLKIKVCASTSCSKKRKILGMDEFATFGGVYERAGTSGVSVEESTCLGKCKMAPCVAVEHEDYIGNIGLEGMTDSELSSSMFFGVITEGDCDRIWGCVTNAIETLAEEEDEE